MKLRIARPEDGAMLASLYAPYVERSAISLEEGAPDADQMAERVAARGALYPWLVAVEDEAVVGFASAGQFRVRFGYRFAVETSVYVAEGQHGRGVGRGLYGALLDLLVAQGFTQAIASITLPNAASVRLHEVFGFAPCGVHRQVGWKLGQWWDIGLWQRPLAPVGAPPQEPRPFDAFIESCLPDAGAPPSRPGR
jgi:phosphinothricin acetyltransferase